MEFNKLVRDNIPSIIKAGGEKAITHIAEEKEYKEALENKLHEEVAEFLENPCVEEAADILEVLRAICGLRNISLDNLEEVRRKKEEERGAFDLKIILEKTEI